MRWTSTERVCLVVALCCHACSGSASGGGNEADTAKGGFTLDTTLGGDVEGGGQDVAVSGDAPLADTANGGDGGPVGTICVSAGECDTDMNCGSGNYCDPCEKKCKPQRALCEACGSDFECAQASDGTACIPFASGGSACGKVCLGPGGCPKGFGCQAVGGVKAKQCVPLTGSCGPVAGACKDDAACPFPLVCNEAYGMCVEGCETDTECANGTLCQAAHCKPPCDDKTAPCPTGQQCADGHCKIPGGCIGPSECPDPETHCDIATHMCKPGCVTDFDCKAYGKTCDEVGKCIDVGCTKNYQCAFGSVCEVTTGQCKKYEGLLCATCDPQDGNVKACGGKPNLCVTYKDENDKDVPSCALVCDTAPAGACPSGWQCQTIKDDKGGSVGQFCLRDCTKTPVPATP